MENRTFVDGIIANGRARQILLGVIHVYLLPIVTRRAINARDFSSDAKVLADPIALILFRVLLNYAHIDSTPQLNQNIIK